MSYPWSEEDNAVELDNEAGFAVLEAVAGVGAGAAAQPVPVEAAGPPHASLTVQGTTLLVVTCCF